MPMRERLNGLWRQVHHTARLMIGIPDYEAYCRHMSERHPEIRALSHEEFIRNRVEARYGGRSVRKCPC